jgi:hypothetical protein
MEWTYGWCLMIARKYEKVVVEGKSGNQLRLYIMFALSTAA